MKIGIAILTLNAKNDLPFCLPPLLNSPLKPKVLVVDSSSTDGTQNIAQTMGAKLLHIPKGAFNHGLTRELARKHLNTDIVIMVTQDAYAENESTIQTLIEPLLKGEAALSYARQIPKSSDPFEAFPREFNYPKTGHIRSKKDLSIYGSYLNFFSDSFGAYLNSALDKIGGFPKVILGEDTIACAKLLNLGFNVAYVSEAKVYHSHHHTLLQEFRRHFDTGLTRGEFASLLRADQDQKRGYSYILPFLSAVAQTSYLLLPKGVLHLGAKYFGYKMGRLAKNWPPSLKKRFSSQKYYW